MSVITLPICEKPMLISDENLSMSLAVLEGQGIDIYPWLVCRYGNIKCTQWNYNSFDFCENDPWFVREGVFQRSLFLYDQNMFGANRENILDIVCYSIKHGEYIVGTFDAYYVPILNEYKNLHRRRRFLIYGVDADMSEIYFLAENADFVLTKYTVSFDDFWDSLCGNGTARILFNTFRFNTDFVFEQKTSYLKKALNEFFGTVSQSVQNSLFEHNIFGQEVLLKMREQLCKIGIVKDFIDRDFYLRFYDFQIITAFRCEKIGSCTENLELLQMSTKLKLISNQFVDLCRQYNAIKSKRCVTDVICLFDEIVELDLLAVKNLISLL